MVCGNSIRMDPCLSTGNKKAAIWIIITKHLVAKRILQVATKIVISEFTFSNGTFCDDRFVCLCLTQLRLETYTFIDIYVEYSYFILLYLKIRQSLPPHEWKQNSFLETLKKWLQFLIKLWIILNSPLLLWTYINTLYVVYAHCTALSIKTKTFSFMNFNYHKQNIL